MPECKGNGGPPGEQGRDAREQHGPPRCAFRQWVSEQEHETRVQHGASIERFAFFSGFALSSVCSNAVAWRPAHMKKAAGLDVWSNRWRPGGRGDLLAVAP